MPVAIRPKFPLNMFDGMFTQDITGKYTDLGTWENFPFNEDITLSWTLYDKFDLDPGTNHSHWREGEYVRYITLQVSTDPGFTDTTAFLINSQQNANQWPYGDYTSIYSANFAAGVGVEQTYTGNIPANKLITNKTYYARVIVEYFLGYVNRYDDINNLVLYKLGGHEITKFTIKTKQDTPIIKNFSCIKGSGFDSFGGNVIIKWFTAPFTAGGIIHTSIGPIDIPGLGNVNEENIQGITVFIDKTTEFVLTVTSASGVSNVQKRTIIVDTIEGIVVDFIDSMKRVTVDDLNNGDYVAKIGDIATLQLYTEYVKDVHIFVAYPPNTNSTLPCIGIKVPANPPNLMNDLLDEVMQTVKITIPAPTGIVLNAQQFISGAFGFDGIGKDNKAHSKVCGYFKLIGPT